LSDNVEHMYYVLAQMVKYDTNIGATTITTFLPFQKHFCHMEFIYL